MQLEVLRNINLVSLVDSSISLGAAFLFGGLIGLERQYRQRTAGLRTNILVALGAAIFVDIGNRLGGHDGANHIVAYVVSGIGFLGAGVIMREDGNIRGLNTAATLWGSAAVGACAGADLILEAMLGCLFVLAANTLLRPVVNSINRKPLNLASVEVTNTVYVIANRNRQKEVLTLIENTLVHNHYPIRNLSVHAFGEHEVEIEAILAATSVDSAKLDLLVQNISSLPIVTQAFWSPSTID